jgi:hypothetical protein
VTTATFGTYAVTPTVDVSVVVPFSRVSFRGELIGDRQQFDSGTVTTGGLGDVEARAKWAAWRSERAEAAVFYAVRVPTGSNLVLSSGRAQQKFAVLVSSGAGPLRYHLNAGYAFRVGGQSPGESAVRHFGALGRNASSNEALYAGALEWPLRPRLTLAGEVIGRVLQDSVEFRETTSDNTQPLYPGDVDLTYKYFMDSLAPVAVNQHIAIGSLGAKYRVAGNTVAGFHVLVPLSSAGLRPGWGLTIGAEYGF